MQQNYSLVYGEEWATVIFIRSYAPEGSQTEWKSMYNAILKHF
jgi:hypothetical protein